MNAVAAVSRAAGPPALRAAVTQMLDRMPERGSGHRVIVADEAGVIGAAGAAPAFASKAGCALLAGDLHLDNADDLRHTLGLAHNTAPAVIAIEAFARWGDGFAAHLAGDFALVLIDRAAGRLLAVRDPLGIRPLYYRVGISHVRFASELRALREPHDAPDEGYLAEVLSGDINDVEGTPYLSIRRVPAGHIAIAVADGVKLARYWEPPAGVNDGTLGDHADRFRAAFDAAVRSRCEGRAVVGVHLSGGLDSSSVLGSICANGFAEPLAGSMRFPWPEADESEWIATAARRWSIEPTIVAPPVDPAAHDIASIAVHGDIPDYPIGAPLFEGLHRSLKARGADVVLTGVGGDQWWSVEMAHMADLLRRGHVGALRRWHGAGRGMGEESMWTWRSFARDGLLPLVPRVLRRSVRHLVPAATPDWIDTGFAARVSLRDRLRRRPDTTGAPSESWRRMRWRVDSGEEAFWKERLDRLSVAQGIELRHPFYDRRLVELAFATPDCARIAGGRNRAVVRHAMADRLHPSTAERTSKAELSAVLVSASRHPDIAGLLSLEALKRLGWIRPGPAAILVRRTVEGGTETASVFWRVIGVEALLRVAFGAE